MTLAPGARLGPYEVRGPLGAGGMGEVYRARDPRIGRDVALSLSRCGDTLLRERDAALGQFEVTLGLFGLRLSPRALPVVPESG